jgi:uncharacterized GH25 family protein
MSVDVNAAITDWNNKAVEAKAELEPLEEDLKQSYNNYIDSLVAYLQKVKDTNEIRSRYIRIFQNEDMKNDTRIANQFSYHAVEPIKNIAPKYILDNKAQMGLRNSLEIVRSESVERLLSKKVL